MKTLRLAAVVALAAIVIPATLSAQERRASPRGEAATQVAGSLNAEGQYQGGSWVVVTYGRPILRGRDLLRFRQ